MTAFHIAFDAGWVPDLTDDELRVVLERVTALRAEMQEAGVLVVTGGLDDEAVLSVEVSGGTPVFTDGPYVETKEHLGGFAVVEVPDDRSARFWAGKIAVACGWPQEVRLVRGATTGAPAPTA